MSVPPTNRQSSSSPSGKGRPDESGKAQKKFQLPGRKESLEAKEEEPKKKGIFDLTGNENAIQDKQQALQQQIKTEGVTAAKTAGIEGAAQVNQIGQIVQKMVESMRIGQINGQDFASVDLKKSADVPQAFAGSNLTVSYQDNGIKIHFDNFMTPQQQNSAIALVEKNKDQLHDMVLALNAKNIQVTELSIGTHTVNLPRIEPLPPPFQAPPPAEGETPQGRDRGREGREEPDQGPR